MRSHSSAMSLESAALETASDASDASESSELYEHILDASARGQPTALHTASTDDTIDLALRWNRPFRFSPGMASATVPLFRPEHVAALIDALRNSEAPRLLTIYADPGLSIPAALLVALAPQKTRTVVFYKLKFDEIALPDVLVVAPIARRFEFVECRMDGGFLTWLLSVYLARTAPAAPAALKFEACALLGAVDEDTVGTLRISELILITRAADDPLLQTLVRLLPRATALHTLVLAYYARNAPGLAARVFGAVAALNLRVLVLDNADVGRPDANVAPVPPRQLEKIYLRGIALATPDTFARMLAAKPTLHSISLVRCSLSAATADVLLAARSATLTAVNLAENPFDAAALRTDLAAFLRAHPFLHTVDVGAAPMTPALAAAIKAHRSLMWFGSTETPNLLQNRTLFRIAPNTHVVSSRVVRVLITGPARDAVYASLLRIAPENRLRADVVRAAAELTMLAADKATTAALCSAEPTPSQPPRGAATWWTAQPRNGTHFADLADTFANGVQHDERATILPWRVHSASLRDIFGPGDVHVVALGAGPIDVRWCASQLAVPTVFVHATGATREQIAAIRARVPISVWAPPDGAEGAIARVVYELPPPWARPPAPLADTAFELALARATKALLTPAEVEEIRVGVDRNAALPRRGGMTWTLNSGAVLTRLPTVLADVGSLLAAKSFMASNRLPGGLPFVSDTDLALLFNRAVRAVVPDDDAVFLLLAYEVVYPTLGGFVYRADAGVPAVLFRALALLLAHPEVFVNVQYAAGAVKFVSKLSPPAVGATMRAAGDAVTVVGAGGNSLWELANEINGSLV